MFRLAHTLILICGIGFLLSGQSTLQPTGMSFIDSVNTQLQNGSISKDSLYIQVIERSASLEDEVRDSLLSQLVSDFSDLQPETAFEFSLNYNRYFKSRDAITVWEGCIAHIETLSPTDTLNLTRSWNYCGSAYYSNGDVDKAKEYFLKVIDLISPSSIDEELAVAHNNLATVLNTHNDPGGALPNYIRARDIFIELLGSDHYYIALINNNIGQAYDKLENYEAQRKVQEQSLATYLASVGRLHSLTANVYINLGICYRNLDLRELSLEAFEEAIAIRSELLDDAGVVAIMSEISSTVSAFPEYYSQDDILRSQRNCIAKGVELFDSNHHSLRNIYNNHSLTLLAANQLELALYYLNKSIDISYTTFSPANSLDIPTSDQVGAPDFKDVRLFENKGYILQQLFEANNNSQFIDAACLSYQLGDSLIEILKSEILNGLSRKQLVAEAGDFYINASTCAYTRYEATLSKPDIDLTYHWVEKSRNWDLITDYALSDRARSIANNPIIEKIATLKKQLPTTFSNDANRTSDSLNNLIDVEIAQLKQKYPEYFRLLYNYQIQPLDSIITYCKSNNQQWLHYFGLSKNSAASILVTPDTIATYKLDDRADSISASRRQLLEMIEMRDWGFAEPAHKIYRWLFKPYETILTPGRLIISSGGIIDNIPLDALIPSAYNPDDIEAITSALLVHKFSFSIMPSGTYGLAIFQPRDRIKTSAFLAPDYVMSLEYHINEAKTGSEILDGSLITGDISKKEFTQALANNDLFHFAGHSIAQTDVLDSTYVLLGDGNDTLFLPELFTTNSKARLVVLSSCQSAVGKPTFDGNISLAYGFAFAGTPNVVSSLWLASDRESRIIFTNYYTLLKSGVSSIEAMHLAKMTYLKDAPLPARHPFYWANWTYSGQPVHYVQKNNNILLIIALALGVVFIAGFVLYKFY